MIKSFTVHSVFVCENVKCKNAQTRNLHQKYDHATTGILLQKFLVYRTLTAKTFKMDKLSFLTNTLQLQKPARKYLSFIFSNQLPVAYNNYNFLSTAV